MVEQSDRAPLLDWEEIPPPDPNQAAQPPPQPPREEGNAAEKSSAGTHTPTTTAAGAGWSSTPITAVVTCSPTRNTTTAVAVSRGGSPIRQRTELSGRGSDHSQPVGTDRNASFPGLTARDQWEEKDQIVAVFVVTFDTRSGK